MHRRPSRCLEVGRVTSTPVCSWGARRVRAPNAAARARRRRTASSPSMPCARRASNDARGEGVLWDARRRPLRRPASPANARGSRSRRARRATGGGMRPRPPTISGVLTRLRAWRRDLAVLSASQLLKAVGVSRPWPHARAAAARQARAATRAHTRAQRSEASLEPMGAQPEGAALKVAAGAGARPCVARSTNPLAAAELHVYSGENAPAAQGGEATMVEEVHYCIKRCSTAHATGEHARSPPPPQRPVDGAIRPPGLGGAHRLRARQARCRGERDGLQTCAAAWIGDAASARSRGIERARGCLNAASVCVLSRVASVGRPHARCLPRRGPPQRSSSPSAPPGARAGLPRSSSVAHLQRRARGARARRRSRASCAARWRAANSSSRRSRVRGCARYPCRQRSLHLRFARARCAVRASVARARGPLRAEPDPASGAAPTARSGCRCDQLQQPQVREGARAVPATEGNRGDASRRRRIPQRRARGARAAAAPTPPSIGPRALLRGGAAPSSFAIATRAPLTSAPSRAATPRPRPPPSAPLRPAASRA